MIDENKSNCSKENRKYENPNINQTIIKILIFKNKKLRPFFSSNYPSTTDGSFRNYPDVEQNVCCCMAIIRVGHFLSEIVNMIQVSGAVSVLSQNILNFFVLFWQAHTRYRSEILINWNWIMSNITKYKQNPMETFLLRPGGHL